MKLCIPIEVKPLGGLHTFLRGLLQYLERHQLPFTSDVADNYDVLFVNSWVVPHRLVGKIKRERPGVKVVQRIDGSARDYGRADDADMRQARVNMLADLTVFQSRYGKYATTRKFKVIQNDGPVIYNAVDMETFSPHGTRLEFPRRINVCHATFSTNVRKGIDALLAAAEANPDIGFVLAGRYPPLPDLPNLHNVGLMNARQLAEVYRSCDAFVTFSENDTCPNTVIESLACGLPVLYKPSGGVPELVGDCGQAITVASFREALEGVLAEKADKAARARMRAETRFSPEVIFPQYLTAMRRALRKRLPTTVDYMRAYAQGYPVMGSVLGIWNNGFAQRLHHLTHTVRSRLC